MNTLIMFLTYILAFSALVYSILTIADWIQDSIKKIKLNSILKNKIRKEDK